MTSEIKRSKEHEEEEQKYLEILNKHFEAVTHEKHPNAMLNIIFTDAYEKILGKDFQKKRISKKKGKKLKDEINNRLRRKYGKWINLTSFKIKSPEQISFKTNFNRVYRIKGGALLYGNPSEFVCSGIFYTSHCLERFEERVDPILYQNVTDALIRAHKTEPNKADCLMGLIITSDYEYGRWENFCYLNVGVGAIVLEDLGEVFIAKTFLTSDMLHPEMKWYEPHTYDGEKIESFKHLINLPSSLIETPTFLEDKLLDALIDELFDKGEK